MPNADTIFALATARGRAALASVRISGAAAGATLDGLAGLPRPGGRQAALRLLRHPGSGEALDQALVLWFPAPASATGEDVAELHLHGGPAVIAGVLEALAAEPGLRMAEPGEFARRAFANGKLDLSQIEGLADLVAAETAAQRRQALAQAEGALARHLADWRGRLIKASALIEAHLDFADEDIPGDLLARAGETAAAISREIRSALAEARRGERIRNGYTCALLGAPNVGKSSLLNCLAGRDAAIVTDRPGTTRDLIEVALDIDGVPLTVTDTAGIHAGGEDEIEREGMRRALARAVESDLWIHLIDLSAEEDVAEALCELPQDRCLVIGNKADLPRRAGVAVSAAISAKTGQGLDRLVRLLADRLDGLSGPVSSEAPLVTRARQRAALEEALTALERSRESALPELLAEDLRLALRAFGRVAGQVDVEDVLDLVFREFCIGK